MPDALPYIFRIGSPPHDIGRKGQRCRMLARPGRVAPFVDRAGIFAGALPTRRVMNTRLVQFADGFRMATVGNFLRRVDA